MPPSTPWIPPTPLLSTHLGLARALTSEMPHTLAALTSGEISEWQATLMVRATACLSAEDRTRVDAQLADRLGALSDRRLEDAARAAGDPRTRGQVMADTLTERLTGRHPAVGPDVEVWVLMGTDTFLGHGTQPGWVPGYSSIPAHLAHAWAHADTTANSRSNTNGDSTRVGQRGDTSASIDPNSPAGRANRARTFLRRRFASPDGSRLVGMETGRRDYTGLLAEFIQMRDQTCRTPYCDAPIRHHDHVVPHARGGATSAANGQGLCEACNYLKEHPDWHARPGPANHDATDPNETGPPHTVAWTTPTGQTYHSTAPPLEE